MVEAQFEEQEQEIEAIKYIFMEDLVVIEEKPYKFEVLLKANNEEGRNHLQLKVTFELPENYPAEIPSVRLKNLSPDIIDNNLLLLFEKLLTKKGEDVVGSPMIYEMCEALRERLGEMNDIILKKLDDLNNKDSLDTALKKVSAFSQDAMTFTPVNKETFAKWCDDYKERMRKIKEEMLTERDLKPTGKQIFEGRKNIIDEIQIDEEDDEEFKDDDEGLPEEEEPQIDTALYNVDDLEEDVDFE